MMTARREARDISNFLRMPGSYPDASTSVEVRETHISVVYLTRRFAYKLKKPLRFDFLDYSTIEKRRLACEAECDLNRRLAPGVYQAVVPICRDACGELVLDGPGEPIDWMVKMKRLDDAASLQSHILRQATTEWELGALARLLADFYAAQAPSMVRSMEFRHTLLRHIESNRLELTNRLVVPTRDGSEFGGYFESGDQCAAIIERTAAAQRRFLRLHEELFDDRVCDGRIVDGHGDLRPEHIYFQPEPIVIDCIEFNPEFRQNDIIDELAFFAMECDRLNADAIGDQVLRAYGELSGDCPSAQLVDFYRCYRACVRAKVAAIRAEQANGQRAARWRESAQYLELARRYSESLAPRLLVTVGGLMGTGKTTLSEEIAAHLVGRLLHTDEVRQELISGGVSIGEDTPPTYGVGRYSPANRQLIYSEMLRRLPQLFAANPSVVLDGTFGNAATRDMFAEAARELGARYVHVECHCSQEVSLHRVAQRLESGKSASEARPEFYQSQVDEYEPPVANSWSRLARVDTTEPIGMQLQQVVVTLRELGCEVAQ